MVTFYVERTDENGRTKILKGLAYSKRKNAKQLVGRLNTLKNGRSYRVVRRGR